MRVASSETDVGSRASIATPICESSVRIVRTSFSRGTFVSTSGSRASSDAHRIGSAAFLAPDTRTVPASGRPPAIRSLSMRLGLRALRPLRGRHRRHRQRMNLIAHALTESGVHELVTPDAGQAFELCRHDHRLEVLAVADDFEMLARHAGGDRALDGFGGD